MTEPNGFEHELRERLKDSTATIAAGEDLQRRLIAAAGATRAQPTARSWSHAFRATWALPAAAAVVTLLVAGTAVVAVRAASSPAVIPGTAGNTPTPAVPTSVPVTVGPTSAVPTTQKPTVAPPVRLVTRPATTSPATRTPTATATHPPTPKLVPPPVSPPVLRPSCSAPADGSTEPPTEQAFVQKIVGTFLLCAEPSVFGTDDAGLLISSDGHWARLARDPAGVLVLASDPNSRGTWQVIDVSAMNGRTLFQLNFQIAGSGTVVTIPQFAAAVARMHLDNNGVYAADYIPTSEPVARG